MIGPLTASQRLAKVRKFKQKRKDKKFSKKFIYTCRQRVAEKRLRIQGRFVTKAQAYEMLNLSKDDLCSNEQIQELLTQLGESQLKMNTQMESRKDGGRILKVQNFQALINNKYNLKDSWDEAKHSNPSSDPRDVTKAFMSKQSPETEQEANKTSVARILEQKQEM